MGVEVVSADVDVDAVAGYHAGGVVDGIHAVGSGLDGDAHHGGIDSAASVLDFVGEFSYIRITADRLVGDGAVAVQRGGAQRRLGEDAGDGEGVALAIKVVPQHVNPHALASGNVGGVIHCTDVVGGFDADGENGGIGGAAGIGDGVGDVDRVASGAGH